ncbi:TPA: DUF2975 domain-containing protein, partial [Legionella pneumophila]
MKKIQKTSHILHILFRVLCWAIPSATAYFILFNIERMLNWGAWPFISFTQIHDPAHYSLLH